MPDSLRIANSLAYCARMCGRSDNEYDSENHSLWMWYHAGMFALRGMLVEQIYSDMRARFDEGARLAAK